MTTVREIAEFAGVSKSTVSLVLNNKPGVSDHMRELVMNAFNLLEAGQAKNLDDAKLAAQDSIDSSRKTFASVLSILVLHPPVLHASYVFNEVLQGIEAAADSYNVQLRLVANEHVYSENHIAHLYFSDPNLRPDGVLLFGAQKNEPLLEEAQRLGIPCVVMGREAKKYSVSGIERDEIRYAYQATEHLISLGHRNIAFIGGQDDYDFVHNRREGYVQALEDADIPFDPAWIQSGDGTTATTALLKHAPDITAAIFVNDGHAHDGLQVIAAQGLCIPEDLSVVSFDDTHIARDNNPPLTSVAYSRYWEGHWAVRMLVDQIRLPFIEKMQIMFKAELIIRESCAALVTAKSSLE